MAVTVRTRRRPWTSTEVCWFAGVSYKQLDHWVRKGYLNPGRVDPTFDHGSGNPRAWPEAEVVRAVALATMVCTGISHAKAAELVADGQRATLLVEPLPETLA